MDLNIIVATGVYQFLELPSFLAYRADEVIVELFVREIREGIDDTGVKAAFLKCGVEQHGLIGDIPRILALIAAASVETGAPVMVHTNAPAQTGLLALNALTARRRRSGADRDRPRRRQQRPRLPARDRRHGGEPRLRPLQHRALQPRGEAHRDARGARRRGLRAAACISGTTRACFYDFMFNNPFFADEQPDYLHISHNVLPALLAAGVTQEQIDQMLVDNPRRFFTAFLRAAPARRLRSAHARGPS